MSREVLNININRGPTVGGALFIAMVITALTIAYWQYILTIVVACALIGAVILARAMWVGMVDDQVRINQRLAADADLQHQQVMSGDPRGTYGKVWPDGEDAGR